MLNREKDEKKLLEDYKQIMKKQMQKEGFATVESFEKFISSVTNLRNIENLLLS